MKITVTVDLNEVQIASITKLAAQYPHGWHTADLLVRKDAVERGYEADWALSFARGVVESTKSPWKAE